MNTLNAGPLDFLPDDDALFAAVPPPPIPIDNVEDDSKKELTELQQAFRARAKAEKRRMQLACDSEYWCALCFQTRDEKNAFLAALNLPTDDDKYIDGRLLADALGIELPEEPVRFNTGKVDKKLLDLC